MQARAREQEQESKDDGAPSTPARKPTKDNARMVSDTAMLAELAASGHIERKP